MVRALQPANPAKGATFLLHDKDPTLYSCLATIQGYINSRASDYFFRASDFKMNSLQGGSIMSYDLNHAPLFPYGFPMPSPIPLLFSHDNYYQPRIFRAFSHLPTNFIAPVYPPTTIHCFIINERVCRPMLSLCSALFQYAISPNLAIELGKSASSCNYILLFVILIILFKHVFRNFLIVIINIIVSGPVSFVSRYGTLIMFLIIKKVL